MAKCLFSRRLALFPCVFISVPLSFLSQFPCLTGRWSHGSETALWLWLLRSWCSLTLASCIAMRHPFLIRYRNQRCLLYSTVWEGIGKAETGAVEVSNLHGGASFCPSKRSVVTIWTSALMHDINCLGHVWYPGRTGRITEKRCAARAPTGGALQSVQNGLQLRLLAFPLISYGLYKRC